MALRDPNALLVALRQRADQLLAGAGEPAALLGNIDGVAASGLGHAVQLGGEQQIFVDVELAIQRRRFRQIADLGLGASRVIEQIDAANADRAAGGREIAGQHLHGRGFAGAVGAQETEHFPAFELEIDAVDCGMGAETAREPARGDRGDRLLIGHRRCAIRCGVLWCAQNIPNMWSFMKQRALFFFTFTDLSCGGRNRPFTL